MGMFDRLVGWFQDRGGVPPMAPAQAAPDPVRAMGAAALARDNHAEAERFDPRDDDKWPLPSRRDLEREEVGLKLVEQTDWQTIQAGGNVYGDIRHAIYREEDGSFYVRVEDDQQPDAVLSIAAGRLETIEAARFAAQQNVGGAQEEWARSMSQDEERRVVHEGAWQMSENAGQESRVVVADQREFFMAGVELRDGTAMWQAGYDRTEDAKAAAEEMQRQLERDGHLRNPLSRERDEDEHEL